MQFKEVTSKYLLATLPLSIALVLGSCGGGDDKTTANPTTNLNPSSGSTTGTTTQPVKYQLTRAENDYSGDGTIDAVYTYTSDSAGNLTKWESYGTQGELRYVGIFTYDANKKLVKEAWDSEGLKDGKRVPLDGVIDGIVEYSYDSHGNLTRVSRKNAYYSQTSSYTNKYDANGQLIQLQSDYESDGVVNGVVNYSYANGRLTQQQIDNNGDAIIDEVDSYTYDVNGKLVKFEYATKTDTTSTNYAYDANGRLSQQKLVYSDNTSYTTDYFYNTTGKLAKEEVNVSSGGNPATKTYTTYTYDTSGNVVEEKKYNPSGNLSQVTHYGWQSGNGYTAFSVATDPCLLVNRDKSPEEGLFDSVFTQ
jgi:hypothetical protein